jgi:integrase
MSMEEQGQGEGQRTQASQKVNKAAASTQPIKRPRGTGAILRRKNSPYWWLQFYRNGRPFRESTQTTDRRKAERMLARRLASVASGQFIEPKHERITVGELYEALLTNYEVNQLASLEGAKQRWEKRLKDYFGHLQARAVTTDLLNAYVLKCKTEGKGDDEGEGRSAALTNATINRDFAALKRAFNLAYRSTPRKVSHVPTFPHLDEAAPRRGFIEQAQYDVLAKHAKSLWLRAFLAVAYSFGFRKGELLGLRVRQVDLASRTITLDPGETKNGEPREVHMTQDVYELLKACVVGKERDDFVFTRENGKPVLDFREAWEKLITAAGLPGLLVHDLRRSAVRNMVRKGVPERVAMAISGHKTRTVFERYNIVSKGDLEEAARKIEKRIEEKDKSVEEIPPTNGRGQASSAASTTLPN